MTSTRSLRVVAAAALSALTLTLAACGGDSDADSDATTATTGDATDATTAPTDASESTDEAATGSTTGATGTVAAGAMDRDAFVAAGVTSLGMPDDSGECLVEAVIDGAGFDAIEESGATPDSFWASSSPLADIGLTEESDEIDDIADNIADCDNLIEAFAAGAEQSVTAEQLDCMNDGDAQRLIGEVLALSLVGGDTTELDAEGQALGEECGLN